MRLLGVRGYGVALVMLVAVGVSGPAGGERDGKPHTTSGAFERTLSSIDPSSYLDVTIVFDDRADASRLTVFERPFRTFKILPFARIMLRPAEINAVASWPHVRYVEPTRPAKPANDDGRALTGVEEVQADLGFTGKGVEVAVIDTGADATHRDLDQNIATNWYGIGDNEREPRTPTLAACEEFVESGSCEDVFVGVTPDGIDVQTAFVDRHVAAGVAWNSDPYVGHGTHVAGTIAGSGERSEGRYRGMAPDARLHVYNILWNELPPPVGSLVIPAVEAFDHILEQNRIGAANIRLINASWFVGGGCEFEPFAPVNVATRQAYDAGILTVFAYGNFGPDPGTCSLQTTPPYVLAAGMMDHATKLADLSSRGWPERNHDRELALQNLEAFLASSPAAQTAWDEDNDPLGVFRPGLVAPGVNVISTVGGLSLAMTVPSVVEGDPDLPFDGYGRSSGTSMAAPHVTGTAALVIQAYEESHPGQRLSPLDIIRILEATADGGPVAGYEAWEVGAGFLDARAAVELAISGPLPG